MIPSLGVFGCFFKQIFHILPCKSILQRLIFRHKHVLFPDDTWNKIWNFGRKNIKKKGRKFTSKWKKMNPYAYRWALDENQKDDEEVDYWCGVRKECIAHHTKDCKNCINDGRPVRSVPVCVDNKEWVVCGIAQGNPNKFTE